MFNNARRGRMMTVVLEYTTKIWLFWLSLFWFMYATIVNTGTLPTFYSSAGWRLWAIVNGLWALYFFLKDPHKHTSIFRVRLATGSIVGFAAVRSVIYLFDGRYAIIPVWGLIGTLSLHAYKLGKELNDVDQALCKCDKGLHARDYISKESNQAN